MSTQILDTVHYQQSNYEIIEVKGKGLPTPQDFGMKADELSTACYRGYFMEYICRNGRLTLTGMTVCAENDRFTAVGGVKPVVDSKFHTARYNKLNVPTLFTGSVLMSGDAVRSASERPSLLRKMSSQRRVLELRFEAGELVDVVDYSNRLTQLRGRRLAGGEYGLEL